VFLRNIFWSSYSAIANRKSKDSGPHCSRLSLRNCNFFLISSSMQFWFVRIFLRYLIFAVLVRYCLLTSMLWHFPGLRPGDRYRKGINSKAPAIILAGCSPVLTLSGRGTWTDKFGYHGATRGLRPVKWPWPPCPGTSHRRNAENFVTTVYSLSTLKHFISWS
jgi:hypothetical protein